MSSRRSGARLWLLAFAGFFLLHAGWALAAPYNGPPDEQRHAIRAAGVLDGQLFAPPADPDSTNYQGGEVFQTIPRSERDGTGFQTVPRSLVRPRCFPQKVSVAADCAAEPGGDQTPTAVTTEAARFNPVYYLVTSWPLGPWPNWLGITLSRLLNAAAMAMLLAGALLAAVRWTRHRAMVAGIVVAATPMTAHLGGAINPNGLEIAAAVALFTALTALVHQQRDGISRATVALAGVSAVVLVTPRFTGVMWLAVILGVLLVPSSRARLRELAGNRTVRIWSAVVAVSTLAAFGWTLAASTVQPHRGDLGLSWMSVLRTAIVDHMWPNVANQMVGVMGWAETLMPRLVYVAWFAAVGLLVLGALVVGARTDRWRLLALFFGTFTPLLLLEILTANQVGWFNQGRYFLTGAVGLPLLGAWILAQRRLSAEQVRSTTRLLAGVLLPIHVVCLAYTMSRWQSGLQSLNPLNGSWLPPYGAVLPLACAGAAVAVLGVTYWLASRVPTEAPTTDQPASPEAVPAQG